MRGELRKQASLQAFTSWRVGGCATSLYLPADKQDLIDFIRQLPQDEPVLWLGLGSNTLIRDGGVVGTVIVTQGCLDEMRVDEHGHVHAEAGVACAKLARTTARNGLLGLEFFAGIPGTVGGALFMNAGCHGGETWNHVVSVETIDRQGQVHKRDKNEYEIHYRHIKAPQPEWFLSAEFALTPGEAKQAQSKIKELVQHRLATQPINLPNCGSVFRNPPNNYAAKLIEECGLKGFRINDAEVSSKHANFIINNGNASAADIEQLIQHIQAQVKQQHGIDLIREIHAFGGQQTADSEQQTAPSLPSAG